MASPIFSASPFVNGCCHDRNRSPDHREDLLNQAKALNYVYADQIYLTTYAASYPSELETRKSLKDGLEIKIRPIKPSDEDMMRRLFYNFSDESKYFATLPANR